jgi:hypothetical protein
MTYSPRRFLLGPDDTLCRLASAPFSRMVDDPESHRLERFADQRVRMLGAIGAMREGKPEVIVRLVYQMLGFDREGRLLAALAVARAGHPAGCPRRGHVPTVVAR